MSLINTKATNGIIRFSLLLLSLFATYAVRAQESADKIIAVVGRSCCRDSETKLAATPDT